VKVANTDGSNRADVSGVLEEVGALPQAEMQLREFMRASPRSDADLILARFLIRHQRFGEALNVCDGAWSYCPPAAVAETCLNALTQMPPDAAAIGRVAARFEAAHAKSPDELPLLAALATVRNFEGKFDEAEVLYRRILEKDPGHRMALNNLAWLLALKGGHGKGGHAEEAVALVSQAIQATGTDPNLLDTRAVAFMALNKAKFAVKDLEQAISASPSRTAYFHLAQAHLQAANRNEALKAWKKANEGTPLKPEGVHPLERTAFDRLVADLGPPK
jgi:tetratricopeptide (TPR) repeat protein